MIYWAALSISIHIYVLTKYLLFSAVRNDRNKKRKTKREGCVSSEPEPPINPEELTEEDEEAVDKILKAHEETFPYLTEDDKYRLVSNTCTYC